MLEEGQAIYKALNEVTKKVMDFIKSSQACYDLDNKVFSDSFESEGKQRTELKNIQLKCFNDYYVAIEECYQTFLNKKIKFPQADKLTLLFIEAFKNEKENTKLPDQFSSRILGFYRNFQELTLNFQNGREKTDLPPGHSIHAHADTQYSRPIRFIPLLPADLANENLTIDKFEIALSDAIDIILYENSTIGKTAAVLGAVFGKQKDYSKVALSKVQPTVTPDVLEDDFTFLAGDEKNPSPPDRISDHFEKAPYQAAPS